jgi:hypothetical protein
MQFTQTRSFKILILRRLAVECSNQKVNKKRCLTELRSPVSEENLTQRDTARNCTTQRNRFIELHFHLSYTTFFTVQL